MTRSMNRSKAAFSPSWRGAPDVDVDRLAGVDGRRRRGGTRGRPRSPTGPPRCRRRRPSATVPAGRPGRGPGRRDRAAISSNTRSPVARSWRCRRAWSRTRARRGRGMPSIVASSGRSARRARVGTSAPDQALRVDAAHPGHDRQVVVVAPALDAGRVPGADPAMVDRIRVGRGQDAGLTDGDPGVEPRPDVAEVGGEVGGPVRVALAVAGDDDELLGLDPLELLEQGRVDAHLEDRAALDRTGELGVGDVVAPDTEDGARAIRSLEQEVGVAAPATVEEGRLEDDVGAVAHRLEGLRLRRPQLVRRAQDVLGELDDARALGPQRGEVVPPRAGRPSPGSGRSSGRRGGSACPTGPGRDRARASRGGRRRDSRRGPWH